MVEVEFPTPTGNVGLLVASEARTAFEALAHYCRQYAYPFRELAGGTYNCRPIGDTTAWSLHAYGVALDYNPSKNPQGWPVVTDIPTGLIEAVEGIRTVSGATVFTWGGRWPASTPPDPMHFQINCSPADIAKGLIMANDLGPNGEPNWSEVSTWARASWTEAHRAGLITEDSHPGDPVTVEQLMVFLNRAKVI
jgi:hypothetical protein